MLPRVDELGLKILFLLIPGIISLGIIKSIGPKRPRSDFEMGLQIFLYGIVCYAITGFIEGVCVWHNAPLTDVSYGFWQTVFASSLGLMTLNPEAGLSTGQIGSATAIALVVGCTVANMQRHSVPHRILNYLKLTSRTSEVDIWEFTLNSPNIDTWATIRHDSGKVYQGWVRGYSDGGDERELLLSDVRVFAALPDSNELMEVDTIPVLYLGLDRKNTVLEFRTIS
jgi:hypothetical protein